MILEAVAATRSHTVEAVLPQRSLLQRRCTATTTTTATATATATTPS